MGKFVLSHYVLTNAEGDRQIVKPDETAVLANPIVRGEVFYTEEDVLTEDDFFYDPRPKKTKHNKLAKRLRKGKRLFRL